MQDDRRAVLEASLRPLGAMAVAVSGGVDSLTLATLAHGVAGGRAAMFHAVSPAVPPEATGRVRAEAARQGWHLIVLEAGEFNDPRYRANPADRCFFCKTNLYGVIAARTKSQILSGTNRDDLGEYRPGLKAAHAYGVRHPYVEAGMDKAAVRRLALALGLPEIAALPASPCLSSRVETGLRIEAHALRLVHRVEGLVSEALHPRTVRCRLRASGLVVELDEQALAALSPETRSDLVARIAALGGEQAISFAAYRNGSAFLVARP